LTVRLFLPFEVAALVVLLAACRTSKTHEVAVPPAPLHPAAEISLDATIEGEVVDPKTHERLAGALLIAEPALDGVASATAISDPTGHYTLRVPAARHRVTAYYDDAVIDAGIVEVAPHQVARRDVTINHEAIEAAAKAKQLPACPLAAGPPASTQERERLASQVLARGVSAIPDGGLLPESGPILVASDFTAQVHLSNVALGGSKRFVLKTMRELQAEADRTDEEVMYIHFEKLDIAGTCATVDVGVGIVLPSHSTKTPSCCCDAVDLYELRNGHWTFRTNVSTSCS
jgi:hypothetical protein